MRAGLYLRVSTDQQTTENQRQVLLEVAARRRWEVVAEFSDNGVSGAKGRSARPGLEALLKAVTRREVDVVMAWSVDRLGRSLKDLVLLFEELKASGVDLYLHQQAVDTSTPAGKALLQMAAIFGEFERAMLVERTKAGIARARRQGKRLGRPPTTPKIEARVRALRAEGMGMVAIARRLGIGTGVVQRVCSTGQPEASP